ncbi:MAG: DNA-3-methyladenine glycosylase [Lentisphaerae bacterium]|nr:DNA-3-methyladenine glycosylase [Lentisphaerota bacterium]
MPTLARAFYTRPDVVGISRELLGMYLFTRLGGRTITGGRIVETEAYAGPEDRASHAYGGRRTPRTEVMYRIGGTAYVYLCYGLHALFNVVTHTVDVPHAVLVRAVEPTHGLALIRRRRGPRIPDCRLAAGPGCVTRALGITTRDTGTDLTGNRIWIERRGPPPSRPVLRGPRIGVAYAGPHARRLWRFRLA